MPKSKPQKYATKSEALIASLHCKLGLSVTEIAHVQNWQPHTVRAALTRLRQQGWTIEKLPPYESSKASRYRVSNKSKSQ